eukprot:6918737-Pyramimonas_sp.AAC.1
MCLVIIIGTAQNRRQDRVGVASSQGRLGVNVRGLRPSWKHVASIGRLGIACATFHVADGHTCAYTSPLRDSTGTCVGAAWTAEGGPETLSWPKRPNMVWDNRLQHGEP